VELKKAEKYFATARERYWINYRREIGWPREHWTQDPVYKEWRFCNVHREHDKTTRWFAENVRKRLVGYNVVRATLIFRWFNRIETGEKLLPWLLWKPWDESAVREALKDHKPLVTGAFMIKTVNGMNKLDGMMYAIQQALKMLPDIVSDWDSQPIDTLEYATKSLTQIPHIGRFMAYEIVSDLRWTEVLQSAQDIMTWANAGPGCAHGLGRVLGEGLVPERHFDRNSKDDQATMCLVMQELLELSKSEEFWPQGWVPWEMREAEHWACEFDKYERAEQGDKMKRRFKE